MAGTSCSSDITSVWLLIVAGKATDSLKFTAKRNEITLNQIQLVYKQWGKVEGVQILNIIATKLTNFLTADCRILVLSPAQADSESNVTENRELSRYYFKRSDKKRYTHNRRNLIRNDEVTERQGTFDHGNICVIYRYGCYTGNFRTFNMVTILKQFPSRPKETTRLNSNVANAKTETQLLSNVLSREIIKSQVREWKNQSLVQR